MDIRHLRYFVSVVEQGGVVQAARHLHVSQPSLSRQLHDLEAELGVALFERMGRRLRLTGAGEDLVPFARRVLHDAEAVRERARLLQHSETGVLRVGATPQRLERFFPSILARIAETLPAVEVRLSEGSPADLVRHLRDAAVDFVLTDYRPEWCGTSRILGRMPLLAVRSRRDGGCAATVDLRTLEGEPLFVLSRGFASRELFEAACRLARIHPSIALESHAPATLLALVGVVRGVAILPATVRLSGRDDLTIRRIVREGEPLEMFIALHWSPDRLLPPIAERFVDEMVACMREELQRTAQPWDIQPPASGRC